jgi:hypothetical protein
LVAWVRAIRNSPPFDFLHHFPIRGELGDKSPLRAIKTWSQFKPLAALAAAKNKSGKDLARQAEKANEDRDLALGQRGLLKENTVRWYVNSARDVLVGPNQGNEHAQGDWNFTVGSSVSAASLAKKAAKAKPAAND